MYRNRVRRTADRHDRLDDVLLTGNCFCGNTDILENVAFGGVSQQNKKERKPQQPEREYEPWDKKYDREGCGVHGCTRRGGRTNTENSNIKALNEQHVLCWEFCSAKTGSILLCEFDAVHPVKACSSPLPPGEDRLGCVCSIFNYSVHD